MGLKWTAKPNVGYKIMEGQPKGWAQLFPSRESGQFRSNVKHGAATAPAGVKRGSTKVEVTSQGSPKH